MDIFSKINGIYAITPNQPINYNRIERYLPKVSILQYRRKDISTQEKYQEILKLKELINKYKVSLIINDDVALTLKTNAFGVHLGSEDITIKQARRILKANQIIGISCYNDINLAIAAQENGANYVAFGSVFPSKTKPNAIICPLDVITQAKKILDIPIVAIGGINLENSSQVFNAGANAVAMIDALNIS